MNQRAELTVLLHSHTLLGAISRRGVHTHTAHYVQKCMVKFTFMMKPVLCTFHLDDVFNVFIQKTLNYYKNVIKSAEDVKFCYIRLWAARAVKVMFVDFA